MQPLPYISLQCAGKRFNRDWIFRNITYDFHTGKSYAITGPNGSGKSTLLQCIAAAVQVSEGEIIYSTGDKGQETSGRLQAAREVKTETENVYKYISIAAPYLEVIEEMTAIEFLEFHAAFKPLLSNITIPEILAVIGLSAEANKQIRFYSSGMKQRVKLAQAVFSNAPFLLLDEPCTNFDAAGYALYHHLIAAYCSDKLIIVSSNDVNEYDFCEAQLNMADYK